MTTPHDSGGDLERPLDTLFWALTISWSQLLAHVCCVRKPEPAMITRAMYYGWGWYERSMCNGQAFTTLFHYSLHLCYTLP